MSPQGNEYVDIGNKRYTGNIYSPRGIPKAMEGQISAVGGENGTPDPKTLSGG